MRFFIFGLPTLIVTGLGNLILFASVDQGLQFFPGHAQATFFMSV